MKIRIEIDENLIEDEVVIHCAGINDEVTKVQKAISEVVNATQKLVFYKDATEYYLELDEILFFETDESGISAHTKKDVYQTKYKLYELEDLLPGFFMRVSKSTILNTRHIYSINRNLTDVPVGDVDGQESVRLQTVEVKLECLFRRKMVRY